MDSKLTRDNGILIQLGKPDYLQIRNIFDIRSKLYTTRLNRRVPKYIVKMYFYENIDFVFEHKYLNKKKLLAA